MKRQGLSPIFKIILCIIVSLVIDGLFLYTEFWYFIYLAGSDSFFGLFTIPNEVIGIILFFLIAFFSGIVIVLAAVVLKLLRRDKIIFIALNFFVIIGFVAWWLWECYSY